MKSPSTKKLFLEYLREMPNIATACKKAGISRQTCYQWQKKDENFKQDVSEALGEGEEYEHDFVHNKFMKKIDEGDTKCITFYMKTQHPRFKERSFDTVLKNFIMDEIKKRDQKILEEAKRKTDARKKVEYYLGEEEFMFDEATLTTLLELELINQDVFKEFREDKHREERIIVTNEPTKGDIVEEYQRIKERDAE